MRPTTWAGTLVLILAALGAPSCNSPSAGACAAQGRCPNDKPRSPSMVDDCNALLGDPTCGAKYQTALGCLADHEQCDPAGNVDSTATLQACSAPYDDWLSCSSASSDAAGE